MTDREVIAMLRRDGYHDAAGRMEALLREDQHVCRCYAIENGRAVCWGTRERDACSCGGDEGRCSVYPEKRKGVGQYGSL